MCVFALPQAVLADMQGNVQLKTTRHDNFNLANGAEAPITESVQTVLAGLSWYKGSSKDYVWLLSTYYSFNKYEKYTHLSGSSLSVMGGVFYRFNPTNSMTLKLGKRERKYDDEELSLYQDDAHFVWLQFSHRLSPTTKLNEKISYEENEPSISANKYNSTTGQLWFDWKLSRSLRLYGGYKQTSRIYENSGNEYVFEEPYASLSYSLARNMFAKVGYSKLKMTDSAGSRAYNPSAYLSIGFGF